MKITVIHTTAATLQSLPELIAKEIPGAQVSNLLDDSILPDMNAGHNTAWVRERWIELARIAVRNGAQAVLSACSTVGEFAEEADALLDIPVLRIDAAMARQAALRGGGIAVFATLQSTLGPTVRLIERLAAEGGGGGAVTTVLVEGAYDALMAGDRPLHDRLVAEALARHAATAGTLVLAQASMAPAAETLGAAEREKVLTSPLSGVRFLRDRMSEMEQGR